MKTRVLMTADAVGGIWGYATELARALGENAEILLATMGPPPSADQVAELAPLGGVTLRSSSFKLEWMESPWEDVDRAGEWLLGLERKCRPDVVHLNGYSHAAIGFEAPVLVVAHSCVTTWWRDVHGEDPPPAWHHYRHRVARGVASADRVVAPSRAMLDALCAAYPVPTPADVIPNGIDTGAFAGKAKERFVAAAGRLWDEAKNVSRVVEASRDSEWPVLIAGDGAPEAAGPDARARFLGVLPRVAVKDLLARASVFVHVPLYEPFGLAPLEAALSGCAMILSDIPSMRENWQGRALFVEPRDTDAIAAAMETLASNAVLREGLATQARAHAAQFTARRMASRYLDLYRSLAASRRNRTSPSRKEPRPSHESRSLLPLADL